MDFDPATDGVFSIGHPGYKVLITYTLSNEAFAKGYYDIFEQRAKALLGHPDLSVCDFAAETIKYIEIFGRSEDSYGYMFYRLPEINLQ